MLIKELRQGVRASHFSFSFLGVQVALASIALFTVVAADTAFASTAASWLMFGVLSLWLLIFLPIRSLASLVSELRDDTLELVVVTRLSAWRIVTGKFVSGMAQGALVASLVLPYVLLQYFVAGIDVISEVMLLGVILLCGALAGAGMLFAATLRSDLARNVTVGLLSMGALGTLWVGVFFHEMQGAPEDFWLAFVLVTLSLTLLLLELACARIAPPAENHALRKRLGMLAGVVLLVAVSQGEEAGLWLALLLLVFLGTDAAADPSPQVAVHYLPFAGLAPPLRFAGRLLCPGWVNGSLLCVLAIPLGMALLTALGVLEPLASLAQTLALLACVLLPVTLARGPLRWGSERPWVVAWVSHAGLLLVTTLVYLALGVLEREPSELILQAPLVAALDAIFLEEELLLPLVVVYAPIVAIELAILLWALPGGLREVSAHEAVARGHWERVRADAA